MALNSELPLDQLSVFARKAYKVAGEVIERTWAPLDLHTFPGVADLRREATDLALQASSQREDDDRYYRLIEPTTRLQIELVGRLAQYQIERTKYPNVHCEFNLDHESHDMVLRKLIEFIGQALEQNKACRIEFIWKHHDEYEHNDCACISVVVNPEDRQMFKLAYLEFFKFREYKVDHYTNVRSRLSGLERCEQTSYFIHQTGFREMQLEVEGLCRERLEKCFLAVLEAVSETPRVKREIA